jgi:hypothetical protein
VRDFVPKDHVSRFIVGLVRESLDLKAIMCSYVSGLGQPPFDPRMMRIRRLAEEVSNRGKTSAENLKVQR